MVKLVKNLILLIAGSIAFTAILTCSKSSRYELDLMLRAPDSTQTAFITNQSWRPEIDLRTDVVLFQLLTDSQTITSWQKNGYQIQFQIDSNLVNSSNLNADIVQRKHFPIILSINGKEPQFDNSEKFSLYESLQSSTISGIQGEFKPSLSTPNTDSNSTGNQLSCFKDAFLKGSFFKSLFRKTKKPLWFNVVMPSFNENLNWPVLWTAYQQTMVALLMHPEITGFHFQPIAERSTQDNQIVRLNQKLISQMACFNNILHSLYQFKSDDFTWFSAINHVGQIVSQSIYLPPDSSQHQKSEELASSLMNLGIPIERLILERCNDLNYLNGYRILLLDYHQQLRPGLEIHSNLARWIKVGGVLILSGNGDIITNQGDTWWKKLNYSNPIKHLFHLLEMPQIPEDKSYKFGNGTIIFRKDYFFEFENRQTQFTQLCSLIEEAIISIQDEHYFFKPQNYLCLYRGPLVLAAVMTDTENKKILEIPGMYIDCLAPSYPMTDKKIVEPGEVALLFNLKKFQTKRNEVILSNSKITNQKLNSTEYAFDSQGPSGMECHTFIKLSLMPRGILLNSQGGEVKYRMEWYPNEKLLHLVYPMMINGVHIKLSW